MKLNLACGSTYVQGNGWTNLDFEPLSPDVQQADLLRRLPIPDDRAEVVYTSHFLEHVPRDMVPQFLRECYRVLRAGGVVRIVVPDLENICRTYLAERDAMHHDRASFVALELIDQCVRKESGGQLGRFYDELSADLARQPDMASFVTERTGHDLTTAMARGAFSAITRPKLAERAGRKLSSLWLKAALALLPPAFRAQNVSLAQTGETHQWMWDFHMLKAVLLDCGFIDVARCDCRTSSIASFPVEALDLDPSGQPRKGAASMYVEARKPGS